MIFKSFRENMMRTKTEGLCRWPNKKVVEMSQHASKIYMPRKYVIYQCSDDTTCCGSSEKTCVAKRSKELTLWFQVRYVSKNFMETINKRISHWLVRPFVPFLNDWHLRPQEEPNYKMMMNRTRNVLRDSHSDSESRWNSKLIPREKEKGQWWLHMIHLHPIPNLTQRRICFSREECGKRVRSCWDDLLSNVMKSLLRFCLKIYFSDFLVPCSTTRFEVMKR